MTYQSGVLNGLTIKSITAGQYHTCVITSDSGAYCWGYNNAGQLGIDSTVNSYIPAKVTKIF
jgi:alpha-tubulin suppressor-like RCC1 family protein